MKTSSLVRLFISSTFSDFENERDALKRVKNMVINRIHQQYPQHDLQFQEVDLRWGISERDAISQRTMSICKEELRRCQHLSTKPNFLFFLGDRYGWQPIPETIPSGEFLKLLDQLDEHSIKQLRKWYWIDENDHNAPYVLRERTITRENWIKTEKMLRTILQQAVNHLEWEENDPRKSKYFNSATEQEIHLGLLESLSTSSEHVLCVMRTISDLPTYQEDPDVEKFLDIDEETGKVDNHALGRLASLKNTVERVIPDNIIRCNATWKENGISTDHINQMCEEISNRLCAIIFSRIEKEIRSESLSELELEIDAHNKYANDQSKYFKGRDKALEVIHTYISRESSVPFHVFGEPGTGKSSLLAQASEIIKKQYPESVIIRRFIGVTPNSFNITSLLKSICWELEKSYNCFTNIENQEQPKNVTGWIRKIRNLVNNATKDKPLLLCLDALNQLTDQKEVLKIVNQFYSLPKHVHIIFSSTDDLARDIQSILPLESCYELGDMEEGIQLLDGWLEGAKRNLQPFQRQYLLEKYFQCPRPLFLKLAFESAKHWRSWEEGKAIQIGIGDRSTISDAIHGYLCHLEERHGLDLTSRALSYLVLCKYGLSEQEWYELLSDKKAVLKEVECRHPHSPKPKELPMQIYSGFLHDLESYITKFRHEEWYLITFFHKKFTDVVKDYYIDEAPRQREIREELIIYLKKKEKSLRLLDELAWQLLQNGNLDDALRIYKEAEHMARKQDKQDSIATYLGNQAKIYESLKQYELASEMNKEARRIEWELENPGSSVNSLENQAKVYESRGEYNRALNIYKEVEQITRKQGNLDKYQKKQAKAYESRGEYDRALNIYREVERIAKGLESQESLVNALDNQANIYSIHEEYDSALKTYKRVEEMAHEMNNEEYLASALNNQANIYRSRGEYKRALKMYKEIEEMTRRMNNGEYLASSMNNQAYIYSILQEYDKALTIYKEIEEMARQMNNGEYLASSMNNQAYIYSILQEYDKALTIYKEVEEMARQMNNGEYLASSMNNQAYIYSILQEYDKALTIYKEVEEMVREMNNGEYLASSMNNQANIYRSRGEYKRALKMYKEIEQMARQMNNEEYLASSMNNQAYIYSILREYNKALTIYKEVEQVARMLGNQVDIAMCLNDQFLIYIELGEIQNALKTFEEMSSIFRKIGRERYLITNLQALFSYYERTAEWKQALFTLKELKSLLKKQKGYEEALKWCFQKQINIKQKIRGKEVSKKGKRNSPCPCGSHKKYKKCCGLRERS
ncbi:tetratricopeptide repeat protein [Priestia aryabhattai]|uniref:tetratricopeptide repeat protein n=1 Tax=Priestia aryabhattai TaxID=412384 RepID=UPI0006534C90|nr:tetratricopeptide repeat protein [Priestia aryabhattai]KMN92355.1 hypothetical protein ABV89_27540 [Priestia aryabhattai]